MYFANRWSIRRRLAAVVLVTAVPLTLLLAATIWHLAAEASQEQGKSLLYTARALAAAIDARIDKHIALGRILATSPALLDNNLTAFEADARRAFADIEDTWVAVADLEGQQLMNLVAQPNEPLPKRKSADLVAQHMAFAQNRIVVSDTFQPRQCGSILIGSSHNAVATAQLSQLLLKMSEPHLSRKLSGILQMRCM